MKNLLQNRKTATKAFVINVIVKLSMVFMLLCILSANSFAIGSEMKLSTWNSKSFIVELDHKRHYAKDHFDMDKLNAGNHRLRVMQEQVNIHTGRKRIRVLYNGYVKIDADTKHTFIVRPNNRLDVLRKVRIQRDRRGCHYSEDEHQQAMLDCHGDFNEDSHYEYIDYSEYENYSNYSDYDSEDHYVYELDSFMTDPEEDIHAHCHDDVYEDNVYDEYELIMSTQSFENLIQLLEDEWFDSKKIIIAKGALDNNTFSSAQVVEILESLGFESARLEIAKYAYDSVIDKENYFLVFKVFNFESSIRELQLTMN